MNKLPIIVALLALFSASATTADIVYMDDGRTFEGVVVDLGIQVRVTTKMGVVVLPKKNVVKIEASAPKAPGPDDVTPKKATPEAAAEYRRRTADLDGPQPAARIFLATSCADKGLFDEAQAQLRLAGAMNPKSEELLVAWKSLAEKLPRPRLTLVVTADDGNVIRGAASPAPLVIRHASGVLLIALDKLKGLSLVRPGTPPVVAADTDQGPVEGELYAAPLALKSAVGEFTVPMEKIRRFSVEGSVAPAMAAVDANARADYAKRAADLDASQLSARMALAKWCVDRELLDEAQAQFGIAALIAPTSADLLAAWKSLAEKMPRRAVTLALTLDEGNIIRGTCLAPPLVIRSAVGIFLAPLDRITAVEIVKPGKTPLVAVTTADSRIEGELLTTSIAVKSTLGEITAPVEQIRAMSFEGTPGPGPAPGPFPGPTPLKPPASGDVDLNWDQTVGKLKGQGLEVVICFDSTGSMGGIILECKTRIRQLTKVVTSIVPNARVGIVTYRDWKKYDLDDYEYLVKFIPLQKCDKTGLGKLERFLRECEAYGGGDIPEAVQVGVETSIEKAGWTPGARKVIIVFGDAPPHKENDGLNYTYGLCRKWKASGGALSCIDTTGGSKLMDEFKAMAAAGGGDATFLNDERAIIKQLLVYTFGSKWQKELDKVYEEVLKEK